MCVPDAVLASASTSDPRVSTLVQGLYGADTRPSLGNKEKNIALEQMILQCYDRLLRSAVSTFLPVSTSAHVLYRTVSEKHARIPKW